MLPKVFLTRELPAKAMQSLQLTTDLTWNREDRVLSKSEIISGLANQEGLVCLLTDSIDAEIMDAAPKLKIIANFAVGFNNIDLDAAKARNILVTNTPGVLTDATAELALALMLAVARRVVESDHYLRSGQWPGWGPLQLLGKEISESTLGIIGAGRIGKAVVKRARAFGMDVIYWNRHRMSEAEEQNLGMAYRPLEMVLSQADFVSPHLAYNEETHHFIGTKALQMMKQGSFLINTSRGAVVDENALVAALQSGHLAGAGLDVFEKEPVVHPGLIPLPNVVLLPHLGSATLKTRTAMGMMAVENLLAGLQGKTPPNLVG